MAYTFEAENVPTLQFPQYMRELMDVAVNRGSLYTQLKETLEAYYKENGYDLKKDEYVKILTDVISTITTSITQQAMENSIKIADLERNAPYDLALKREQVIAAQTANDKAEKELDLIEAQIAKLNADTDKVRSNIKLDAIQAWKIQSDLFRDNGFLTTGLTLDDYTISSNVTHDLDYGKKAEELKAAKASIKTAWANYYRQFGNVTYSTDAEGNLTSNISGTNDGLSYWQTRVAERQEQGFDDNMRQHVANSSASMISMLLSTDSSGIDYTPYLNKWTTSIDYLNEV
jgi:hypothetical protein